MKATDAVPAGTKVGRLTILEVFPPSYPERKCACVCECGSSVITGYARVSKGKVKSCGCLQREFITSLNFSHGEFADGNSGSPEYQSWASMISRCENENNPSYPRYGGRGIAVSEEWKHSFEKFLQFVGRKPGPNHTLNRIDNNGNYEPGNVEWATKTAQARNRRSSSAISYQGETKTLAEWCDLKGLPYKQVFGRLKSGWSIDRALSECLREWGPNRPRSEEIRSESQG